MTILKMYNAWALIAIAELIGHTIIIIYTGDHSLGNIAYIVGWSIWLFICCILSVTKTAKELLNK